MAVAHRPATTIQSALICSPWDNATTQRHARPSSVTAIHRTFFQRTMRIESTQKVKPRQLVLGSARVSRVGWKARPLLHPRYGGVSPKRSYEVRQRETPRPTRG